MVKIFTIETAADEMSSVYTGASPVSSAVTLETNVKCPQRLAHLCLAYFAGKGVN